MSVIRFLVLALCLIAAALPAAQAQQQPVILVFGDSLSAGYGLPQGRGWVDLLQQRLDAGKQRLRIVNASISGETTLGGRNRLPAVLAQHRPRLVILQLGANDALRGQSLNGMRDNLEEMVRASREAKAEVLLVGMQIPPNYGQEYTRKFQAVFTEVARTHKVALVPFLLEGFADQPRFFQPDGVHPTVQAQTMMLDNVWSALSPLLPRLR